MEHLSETRLTELALDPASVPQNGEAAHLARCSECAARLAEERRLSELIMALPGTDVPGDFTAVAVERFRRAGRARSLAALPWALLACLAALATTIGLAALAPEPVFGSMAEGLTELTVLVRALDTVLGAAPALGIGLVGAMLVAALVGVGLLAGLARRTAEVKYRGR